MNYQKYLPWQVIECPEIGTVEISPYYKDFVVEITDSWGKSWYLKTIGRDHYEWTRSRLHARWLTKKTAQKYAEIVGEIWTRLMRAGR